ncbi:MAG: ergot alkaloid biosynthesis protein [Hyphomicrobiales bacterium]|nr:MAG: ergot alkaloid biosynthesis protein [Hyphomicrobiales bacterium]
MFEHILVTGGTGKTGRRVTERLRAEGLTPRIATRSPKDEDAVRFQWQDPTTFEDAFRGVQAIYLVAPTDTLDTMGAMQPGLEAAIEAGVKRFVLLSASSIEEGGPMMGAVHGWLRANAPEWAILRPSWFMQNFSEGQHLAPILDDSAIYTATQDGCVGFIDAEDIASCAAVLLTAPKVENTDYILTGPEVISYDSVAEILTRQLGRTIEHKRLTREGIAQRFLDLGFPESYANTLAAMDDTIAGGSEDRVTGNVKVLTGREPTSVDTFVERNVNIWEI